jgi:hypothetical protein
MVHLSDGLLCFECRCQPGLGSCQDWSESFAARQLKVGVSAQRTFDACRRLVLPHCQERVLAGCEGND